MTDLVGPGTPGVAPRPRTARSCVLDIVIPVHNEERDLPGCIRRLHDYLGTEVPYPARITVADNASTDNTLAVAHRLAEELPDVDVIHLDAKGRGGALHVAWMSSPADVVVYMDVDLSTGSVGVDAPGGAADFGSFRSRDRVAVDRILAGGSRPEA